MKPKIEIVAVASTALITATVESARSGGGSGVVGTGVDGDSDGAHSEGAGPTGPLAVASPSPATSRILTPLSAGISK